MVFKKKFKSSKKIGHVQFDEWEFVGFFYK